MSRHSTLHKLYISSKYNTANDDIPDIDIPTWFDMHRLPYNYVIVTKLQMISKDLCVEDLNIFKHHHIEALFGYEDSIVMLRAELAWEDLGGRDQYSFKKANPNLNNLTETNSDPVSSGSTESPSTNKNKTNFVHKNRMPSIFKSDFSTKVTKKKAENIRERDEREALRKKQKLDNCIINIYDDDDIDFGGLGVVGDLLQSLNQIWRQ